MDFAQIIAQIGFPIAVTVFVLVRLESKLEKVVEAVNRLTLTLEKSGPGRAGGDVATSVLARGP